MNKTPLLCIMGPTASGKSALAMTLANKAPIEIISVDSAQIYRGMDIGTAKPSLEEQAAVKHHLINIVEPNETYSVGRFIDDVDALIPEIIARGNKPVLVGGSMLYFHGLQNGFVDLPDTDLAIRADITARANNNGWPAMHDELKVHDPVAAEKIKPNDQQRIERALTVYFQTGKPISQWHAEQSAFVSPYQFINVSVMPDERGILHERIAERFHLMMQYGFLDEVKGLYARGDLNINMPAIRSVGYRQAWQHLQGELDQATMIEKAIIATRQLAKRQTTWLRSWKQPIDPHAHLDETLHAARWW